jgi:RNA polymerase sigma-70 factor (ECF subfamily)
MRQKQSLFGQHLLHHLDGAYNLARWLVERDEDAQTVVQEAYIQALKEIETFRGADVRAWLLTIVRNTAYTWFEKRGGHSNMIQFEEAIPAAQSNEPSLGPVHVERKRHLQVALARLPIEFREVLLLREIEGWSYGQLASVLGISEAAVVSRLSQARQLLRETVRIQRSQLRNEL